MSGRRPQIPVPSDYLDDKILAAIQESFLTSSNEGIPQWAKFFAYCGDGMYRIAVRCSRHFLDVSVRSVDKEGDEDEGVSIIFCTSSSHRSRIQVERIDQGRIPDLFEAIRFGTVVAQGCAEEWGKLAGRGPA